MQILVSAGEVSGDRMAALVVQELTRRWPDLQFFGAGGSHLVRVGVEVRHAVDALAVTGLTEVVSHIPAALWMLADLARQIERRRPALGLLVDYPGINLRLAWLLRRMGVPVLYLGAPQRWAWLESRMAPLRRLDRLAVILPFEEQWFRSRGVNATFVGHPVVDLFRPSPPDTAREVLGLKAGAAMVALLPGSRPNEIRRHMPPLSDAARRLGLPAVVVAAPGCERLCRQLAPNLRRAEMHHALGAATVALCASGSATLEVACAGVPAVVFYCVSPVTYAVARRMVQVPWIALPNLVLQRPLLPELLQHDVCGERLATEAHRLLERSNGDRVREGLRQVRQRLGAPGVAGRVADLVAPLLGRGE